MTDLRAKGWRIAGMFVLMVGAGLWLESRFWRVGAVLAALGLGCFALGLWASAAGRKRE
ncbi:MAG: hypothetical protein KatS3mg076_1697 [Candidatus Binatia bacterium]|nr:MAG: hypothetical protein KatS3mg076_1697 [Candidatus Binatia bacterium]